MFSNTLCFALSSVRAELVGKWKAERDARLARGEKEEEEEEEEEINIYAVTEEEVLVWGPLSYRVHQGGGWVLAQPSSLAYRMEHREGSRQEGLRELSLASFEHMGQFINPVEVT